MYSEVSLTEEVLLISSLQSGKQIYSLIKEQLVLQMSSQLDKVADVDIDTTGRFKYILVKISHGNHHKYIVRGYRRAGYHADIYEEILAGINNLGLEADCVGGGRIEHNKENKSILIYGYSIGFGRADHSLTTEVLKKFYPSYTSITFSNEGY